MANNFPTGIYPFNAQSAEYRLYQVTSSSGTAMFRGDCVTVVTGSSATVPGSVTPSSAGDNAKVVGTVVSLYDNQAVAGQQGLVPIGLWASTVTTKYLPASTAGYALVAVGKPGAKFVAQTNTIMNVGAINKSTALVASAGNTTTSVSGHKINGNDLNSGNQFIILGPWNQLYNIAGTTLNDITVAGALWVVQFNEAQSGQTGSTTGV